MFYNQEKNSSTAMVLDDWVGGSWGGSAPEVKKDPTVGPATYWLPAGEFGVWYGECGSHAGHNSWSRTAFFSSIIPQWDKEFSFKGMIQDFGLDPARAKSIVDLFNEVTDHALANGCDIDRLVEVYHDILKEKYRLRDEYRKERKK